MPRIEFTPKQTADIIRRYDGHKGETTVQIARLYSCSYATIRRVLVEEGVFCPEVGPVNKIHFDDLQQNKILALYDSGMSANKISKIMECSDSVILKFLQSKNIDTKDYGRGKPKQAVPWKGFRKTCRSLTYRIYRIYKHLIDPDCDTKKYPEYHVDHKLSISNGIDLGLTVFDLAHPVNLQLLTSLDNTRKYNKSSWTKRDLLSSIKSWNKVHGDPFSQIDMDIDYQYRYGRYRYFSGTYTHFKVYK